MVTDIKLQRDRRLAVILTQLMPTFNAKRGIFFKQNRLIERRIVLS